MRLNITLTFLHFFLAFQVLAQSSRSKTCTIEPSNSNNDDSDAVLAAFRNCSTNAIIIFKEGANYNIFKPVNAPRLTNIEIRMSGNLHLPKSIEKIQSIVSGGGKTWFQVSGSQVDYIGSKSENNGWINSYGQAWYDANPPGKTGLPNRPHLMTFSVTNGSLRFFKSKKPMGWNVGLSGSNIVVSDAIIDAVSSTSRFPFNTDGFGVSGKNIQIINSQIMNGDDAIAVHNGAHNILFQNNIIGFQTHGMSLGSLGGNPSTVESLSDILFDNVTVKGGLYAARFKSWKGGQGLVRNVTWSNIRTENVTFPIFVTQTYQNQAIGKQQRQGTQSVMMQDFTWKNFSGAINSLSPGDGSCVEPCWYYDGLPGLKHTEAVIIECSSGESCKNFKLEGIDLRPQGSAAATMVCINANAEMNPRLGFKCGNGTMTRA